MENKPIVTCHGDQNLFSSLHQTVVQGLPKEPVEWRRSYGRPPRTIHVEANFVPFNPDILPGEDDWTLLGRPFFHTYWTDCDMDTYKSMVKDDIAEWVSALKSKNIFDWLIIVVVNDENKVKSKLLRKSVIDSVKSDFCGKQTERYIVLSEPFRHDSKASESWHGLLMRMRQLLLQSFNKNLGKFEENMRGQRERRVEKGWSFNQYFLLQEELGFMFEMLSLFEDALVQYDELDALFTQFVLNHAAGDSADWLTNFSKNPCMTWDGLCLSQPINLDKRHLIKHDNASLLDFRNYLFARQCTLLFLMYRPWEVAQRSIPFMHNCIQELSLMEMELPPGGIACWVFLTCLEILNTCEKFTETGQMETYTLHTANLWDYARRKMQGVGELCGLMPDSHTSSEQLNLVVDLIAGMSSPKEGESEPLGKLREALSSKESFRKHYMELSELSMGTFKHIGRIRSARMIGRDLAMFYMKLGEPQHAEGFLADLLKTYQQEGWDLLTDNTYLDMARCQKMLNNNNKYARSCLHIAASSVLDMETRKHYHSEMLVIAQNPAEVPIFVRAGPIIKVPSIEEGSKPFIVNTESYIQMTVVNNLPESVHIDCISLSLTRQISEPASPSDEDPAKFKSRLRHDSTSSATSGNGVDVEGAILCNPSTVPAMLDIQPHFEVNRDKSISSTGMICKTVLRRIDSSGPSFNKERDIKKEDSKLNAVAENILLQPGETSVVLKTTLSEVGTFKACQVCMKMGSVEFLRSVHTRGLAYQVISMEPSLHVTSSQEPLVAGVPQKVTLHLSPGTKLFPEGCKLRLISSEGLQVGAEGLGQDNTITLPKVEPQGHLDIDISLFAELTALCEDKVEKELEVKCDWLPESHKEALKFTHPLKITHRLHTANRRKYIQVMVESGTKEPLYLSEQALSADNPDVELLSLIKPASYLLSSHDQSVTYMWQLKVNIDSDPPLSCTFSTMYHLTSDSQSPPRKCQCCFTIQNYKTLYTVKSEMAATNKEEKCQAGCPCKLKVKVTRLEERPDDKRSLMYQVVADATYWALCGRTTGVFKLTSDEFETILDLVPLTGGFLPLPVVKLHMYDKGPNGVPGFAGPDDTPEEGSTADVVSFSPGQVYNSSAAGQVHILPATNTSHIDVC